MSAKRHSTAGGVVLDDQNRMLVIVRDVARDGKTVHEVRLPKGHIDPGETPEQAALREVREETGYQGLEITADLGTSVSRYEFQGKRHERTERYFLMRLTAPGRGMAQPMSPEEALFVPQWMTPRDAAETLTYESEREFARRTLAILQG